MAESARPIVNVYETMIGKRSQDQIVALAQIPKAPPPWPLPKEVSRRDTRSNSCIGRPKKNRGRGSS